MNLSSIKRTAWQGLDAAVCHSLFNGIKPVAQKLLRFAESGHKSGYIFLRLALSSPLIPAY
jgi:hypothetical protein